MKKIQVAAKTPAASPKARLVIAFAALLSAYYRQPLLFLLLALLLCYLLWSYLWALLNCRYVGVESIISSEKCFAGGTFTWDLRFSNRLPFPLARCGADFLLLPELTCSGNVPLESCNVSTRGQTVDLNRYLLPSWQRFTALYSWLAGGAEHTVRLNINAPLRGIYYLPSPYFFAGEPSGLFQARFQAGAEKFLTVYPRLKNSEEFLEILIPDESSREDRFGLEDYYQIHGVRDYQPGDPPRSINWYATARTGALKANVYQRQASTHCLVVFDLSSEGQPLYEEKTVRNLDPCLEEAISLAAGIALFYLEKGARTAFLTNAPLLRWEKKASSTPGRETVFLKRCRGISHVSFASGRGQARKILELCSAIDQTNRARPDEQKKLWEAVKGAPAHALIYLLRYHSPPTNWEKDSFTSAENNPLCFYTPQRLGVLSSKRVRLLNLSRGED